MWTELYVAQSLQLSVVENKNQMWMAESVMLYVQYFEVVKNVWPRAVFWEYFDWSEMHLGEHFVHMTCRWQSWCYVEIVMS